MEISERLKAARQNKGMTQEQVAEKIMVSRVTVSKWENGKTLPDLQSVIGLSNLYQISLDELLKGDPKMEEKIKKDACNLQCNQKVILRTGIIFALFGVIYLVSRFVGGAFYDFCSAAAAWLFLGTALAGFMVCASQKEKC